MKIISSFFSFVSNGREFYIKLNRDTMEPFITTGESPYWRILVIQSNFTVPYWSKNAVFYQVFLDRFFNSQNKKPTIIDGRNYRNWGEMPNWQKKQ